MFTSTKNKSYRDSFSHRAGKATSKKQKSFKEYAPARKVITQQPSPVRSTPTKSPASSSPTSPNLNSAIVTICVGPAQRLFAAHEDVLSKAPYFAQACRAQFFETSGKRIDLPNGKPEVFSAVLEYLYKGDYVPKLIYDKKRASWLLDDADTAGSAQGESTVYNNGIGGPVLKDTAIYCSAHHYALPDLQRLALKKQGLASGVQCSTILASARYAYAHTPASDSKLRAHYLALIIRSRATFKRSGTLQAEMERGGSALFFDLFVAMVNHLDDISGSAHSPR
ncbi:hypothetical protein LTR91_023903 [Friedmanniomyces endolithicus]|uniref:BTB domain-containing protein n=1 Tax=Friedmanniomyces endolithicus TaxID=329885 RepID=A0AAN6JXD9_9PEZI|nr:hypothetical protein LTR57_024192 [Friedmanniomyces endolithicus]KAK0953344.1 hypothetical protein LTR91_023903 [Friedmanniomyces endolithicus]KAK0991909.1 hypothetical protein LTS01_007998 [Friedmanniomyces endolithicus]